MSLEDRLASLRTGKAPAALARPLLQPLGDITFTEVSEDEWDDEPNSYIAPTAVADDTNAPQFGAAYHHVHVFGDAATVRRRPSSASSAAYVRRSAAAVKVG